MIRVRQPSSHPVSNGAGESNLHQPGSCGAQNDRWFACSSILGAEDASP